MPAIMKKTASPNRDAPDARTSRLNRGSRTGPSVKTQLPTPVQAMVTCATITPTTRTTLSWSAHAARDRPAWSAARA